MKSIQLEVKNKILNLRAIERILKSEDFQQLYNMLSDTRFLDLIIEKGDKDTLKRWLKSQKKTNEQTIRQLRLKARNLGIPNWYNLDQQSLASLIQEQIPN